jgi:uncharacterized protein (DUF305 family)
MVLRSGLISGGLLCLSVATAWSQQAIAPIVQPGAPGENGKTLSAATANTLPRETFEADTKFMQGMIMHHSQAVEMTALMPARTHNKELLAFGKRISISQSDEMKSMKQWLEDRGKPLTMQHDMAHMDHSMGMGSMQMMMPGMLTPEQMQALAKATGPAFDRLFLTGMIQHHGGALTMVQDLFDTPGAGQDNVLYDFATDVDNTQRAEINIMQGMLKGKK